MNPNKPKPPPLTIITKNHQTNNCINTSTTTISFSSTANGAARIGMSNDSGSPLQRVTSSGEYQRSGSTTERPLFVRNNSSPQVVTSFGFGSPPGSPSSTSNSSRKNSHTAIHPFQHQNSDNRTSINRDLMLPFDFCKKEDETSKWMKFYLCCLSLRVKTMSVLMLTFLMIMAMCLIGLVISFDVSFDSVEKKEALDSSRKTAKALFDDFKFISEKVYDFASWDDSYSIMKTENTTIADKMLDLYFSCAYMKRAGINFSIMYYPNGTFFNGRACFDMWKIPEFPDELKALSTSFFQTDDNYNGKIVTSSAFQAVFTPRRNLAQLFSSNSQVPANSFVNATNIILAVALPIQPNNNSDQNGVFLYGRYMTQSLSDDISVRTQYCTTFFDLTNNEDLNLLEDDFKNFQGQLNNKSATKVSIKYQSWADDEPFYYSYNMKYSSSKRRSCAETYTKEYYTSRMATYQLYSDYNNSNSIVIRTDFNREIYQVGWTSFMYTCFVLIAIVFTLLIAVMIFVECVVLRRILKIGSTVKSITKTNDISKRVPNSGFDELGRLCKDINHMLMALEESQVKLAKDNQIMQQLLEKTALEEQKSRCVMNSISDFIVTVECDTGLLVNINTAFENKLLKKNSFARSNSASHLTYAPTQSSSPNSPNSPNSPGDPPLIRRSTVSPPTPNSKNIFETHNIMEYIKDFESYDELKELLESLSKNNNGSLHHETYIQNDFSIKYQVSVSVTKVKMTIREGLIGDAYIVLLRNMVEQKELKNILTKQQEKLEEMKKISEFNRIFKDPHWRELFKVFAASELSVENVHFLEDIETYKSLSKTRDRAALLEEMVNKYLLPESPYPLNVSKKTVETEIKKITSGYGQLDLFDKIESIIKLMVVNDTFSRFLSSKIFRDSSANDLSRTSSSLTNGQMDAISETQVSLDV